MSMDELYRTLRDLVSDRFRIEIKDGKEPTVVILPDHYTNKFPWTRFNGSSLEDALQRAIDKLRNPEKDYRAEPTCINPEGHLWKADESSVYSEDHTRLFLK